MTKKELADTLRNRMFADRDSIEDALEYANSMVGSDMGAVTAIQVILNTLANEIEKLED